MLDRCYNVREGIHLSRAVRGQNWTDGQSVVIIRAPGTLARFWPFMIALGYFKLLGVFFTKWRRMSNVYRTNSRIYGSNT